ncbi:hypothetical protein [Halorarum halobium]|uniref:hypothetical protein n=1 Tax=Halorarum halobium TaxID=3075121 RepID=UPI0028AADC41|nr:hypothetical protein [Halobaculum sp. XH14]
MLDELFHVLSHGTRRVILAELLERGENEAIRALPIVSSGEVSDDEVRLDLHHTHLPMLAQSGYVEWNGTDDRVSRGPAFDDFEPLLVLLDESAESLPGDWP